MASASPVQDAKRDREAIEAERANLMTQLRAQIANQATGIFVALNAGGLAAIFAWLQALPLEPATATCENVMIRSLPAAAALLLLGVIATTVSYMLRYRASFSDKRSIGWMVALGAAALSVVLAGGWIGRSALYCRDMAIDLGMAKAEERVLVELEQFGKTAEERSKYLDQLRLRDDAASNDLQLAISQAGLNEIIEIEKKLDQVQTLKMEYSARIQKYGPNGVEQYRQELADLAEVEKVLQAQLRDQTDSH